MKVKIHQLKNATVLRLYPPVPINSRTALETTVIPTGGGPDGTEPLMVRKGEAVGYSVHAVHRLKRLYGENADSFNPERWDPDVKNPVDLRNIGWGYLPFNGGPRLCLGRKLFLFLFLNCFYLPIVQVQYSHMNVTLIYVFFF